MYILFSKNNNIYCNTSAIFSISHNARNSVPGNKLQQQATGCAVRRVPPSSSSAHATHGPTKIFISVGPACDWP